MQLDMPIISLIIAFLWLLFLSFFAWKNRSSGGGVFDGAGDLSSVEVIKRIAKEVDGDKKDIALLLERVTHLEEGALGHMQRVGLVRFNPFKDTGGEQSFILALTDARQTGIVISGLFSRSGTRWYAKKIIEGKGVEVELSDEEKKAVAAAK